MHEEVGLIRGSFGFQDGVDYVAELRVDLFWSRLRKEMEVANWLGACVLVLWFRRDVLLCSCLDIARRWKWGIG
ncbi:hypothetical protein HHK36_028254 [Tetracentron sinense]|uniref:Uncharacterized protein n=1 Tax=Tetracentron sinense TaxID=13715 RepID=A0A834YG95_TETSI|nr:hypothetical protein HHK36_028254 [Tetracentron sinense]